MKKALWIASVCFTLIAFSSCLSTPATAKDVETEPAAGPVASVTSDQAGPVTPEATVAPVVPADSVASVTPTSESPTPIEPVAESAPDKSDSFAESEEPDERPDVSGIDDVIPPPAEKLLYFYPEPDPLYIAPIAPAPVTETVTTTTKPTASPTPAPAAQKPVAPKAATTKAPTAKTSDKEAPVEVLPGIWTAETVTPAAVPETAKKNAEPSRSVQIAEGQSLEVWYPGSGWVYLGDASAQNGLEYQTRKLDKTDTLFTFRAVKEGSYLLEFTRFDVLEDSFASDTLSVSVYVPDAKKIGKVRAPDYRASSTGTVPRTASEGGTTAPASTGSQAKTASAKVSGVSDEPTLISATVSGSSTTNAAQTPALSASALLESARKSLSSGDVPAALASLETFFSIAVDSIDEGIFLKGQAYEANSSVRDIRKALDAYETLVKSWPDSGRWNDADARIRYIRQFYLGR